MYKKNNNLNYTYYNKNFSDNKNKNLNDFANTDYIALIYGTKAKLMGKNPDDNYTSVSCYGYGDGQYEVNGTKYDFMCDPDNDTQIVRKDGLNFTPEGYICGYLNGNKFTDSWYTNCTLNSGGGENPNNYRFLPGTISCYLDGYDTIPTTKNECILNAYDASGRKCFTINNNLFDIFKTHPELIDYGKSTTKYVFSFYSGLSDTYDIEKNSSITYLKECNSKGLAYCMNSSNPPQFCNGNLNNNTFRIYFVDNQPKNDIDVDILLLSNTDTSDGTQGILEVNDADNPSYINMVPYKNEHSIKNVFSIHKEDNNKIYLSYRTSNGDYYIIQPDYNGGGGNEFTNNDLMRGNPFIWAKNPWGLSLIKTDLATLEKTFYKINIQNVVKTNKWSIFDCKKQSDLTLCNKHDYNTCHQIVQGFPITQPCGIIQSQDENNLCITKY